VSRSASAEEIHAAYRARARSLHPDVVAGDDRAMQDLNEAWRVLGDPARRRTYDATLVRPRAAAVDVEAEVDVGVEFERVPRMPVVRGLPWAILLAVLAAIFVVTAFAKSTGNPAEREVDISPGECVALQPGVGASEVPCTDPAARQVVSVAGNAQPCPTATERFEAASLPKALCLDPASDL